MAGTDATTNGAADEGESEAMLGDDAAIIRGGGGVGGGGGGGGGGLKDEALVTTTTSPFSSDLDRIRMMRSSSSGESSRQIK